MTLFIFTLFFLFTIILSALTTIPFFVGALVVLAVLLSKPWVFFLAFGLGLVLDLFTLRSLGYASLALAILILAIRLYERKFETQTLTFVFISTFLGSITYLWLFGYQAVFMQAFISALISVLLFRFVIPNLFRDLLKNEMLK